MAMCVSRGGLPGDGWMLSGIISAGQERTAWAQGNASVEAHGMGTEKGSRGHAVPRTLPRDTFIR